MPDQESLKPCVERYTTAPLTIWKILSYARLQPLQSMVLNHFIGTSLNVILGPNKKKPITARKWVEMHTSEFANDRACSRQGVREALNWLVLHDFLESEEGYIQTSSGLQRGYRYRLASNKKLEQILEDLSGTINPIGVKPDLTPENIKKRRGVRPDLTPRQARLDTLTGPTCHLDRPYLTPYLVFTNEKKKPKYSLKTFNYFLNTFGDFQNSYLEMYYASANSKASEFKIKSGLASLVRQNSPYSVWIACTVDLFSKDAKKGNLDTLRAFISKHSEEIKNQEQILMLRCHDLYNSILNIHMSTDTNDLKIFHENFRQNASVFFINRALEQSSNEIFLYSSFPDDCFRNFNTCAYNVERFTNETMKNLNLYFRAKTLGMKGLSVAQSLEQ